MMEGAKHTRVSETGILCDQGWTHPDLSENVASIEN